MTHRATRHPRETSWSILVCMKHALVALALSGCVTTAGIVKKTDVSLPLLFGAAVADFAVTSLIAWQLLEYSTFGSLATATGVMGADIAVGCLLGACSSLKP